MSESGYHLRKIVHSCVSKTTLRIAIVGAGPAGIRAAQILVEAGFRPVLIDEAPYAGGQIYRQPPEELRRSARELYGFEARKAEMLHADFERLRKHIDYYPETLVWGVRDNRLLLSGRSGNSELVFDRLILATGAMDRIAPVKGWTQPGVFSLGGAQVVLKYQAALIGERPVFVGTGPLLYLIAWQYMKAGAKVAAVIETGTFQDQLKALPKLMKQPLVLMKGLIFTAALKISRVPLYYAGTPEEVTLEQDALALVYTHKGLLKKIACDAIAIGSGLKPETQLAEILGCTFDFHHQSRHYLPRCDKMGRSSLPHVYIAGDAGAIRGADASEIGGQLAAFALIHDLDADTGTVMDVSRKRIKRLLARMKRVEAFRSGLERAFHYPASNVVQLPDDTILCRCENVTIGDVRAAVKQWDITEINKLKAITRCGMGRCQGRVCGSAAIEILAHETGGHIENVGRFRGQIPLKPIAMSSFSKKATL